MHLFRILLLLFFAVPLLEVYLLIEVGGLLGVVPTVFLVVFTAVLGALLVRWQGLTTFMRVRAMLARGEIPAIELLEGVVLLISGALLLTPGFFTDTLGFLGLVPPLRRRLILWFLSHGGPGGGRGAPPPQDRGPRTIEGEFWKEKNYRD